MIETCRHRYPHLEFRQGDARDLAEYQASSFDFVLFSFNGLDYISHDDRLKALTEVARVLKPGGVFMFSSHNLDFAHRPTFLRNAFTIELSANPLRSAKAIGRIGLRLMNYARNANVQHRTDSHAVLIDPAHEFTLHTYYVTADEQRRQLVWAGFSDDIQIEPGTDQEIPYYLYYVAKKPPSSGATGGAA